MKTLSNYGVSQDNFATGGYGIQNFGTSFILNFNFDTLGQKVIAVRAKNQDNTVSEKQVTINVTRGNSLKINSVQVVSFYGINTSYDPEYPITDPNHLADLRFGFSKIKIGNSFENTYNWRSWYFSPVIQNQGSMTWNTNDANLYINPNMKLRFGLADMDNEIAGADLTHTDAGYVEIDFLDYLVSKPNTITYSFPELNLEFKLFVEWAN